MLFKIGFHLHFSVREVVLINNNLPNSKGFSLMLFKIGFHLHFSVREVVLNNNNLPNERFKVIKQGFF